MAKIDKPISYVPLERKTTRKCLKCGVEKNRYAHYKGDIRTCNECKGEPRKAYTKSPETRALWAKVCEAYIYSGGMDLQELADQFKITRPTVSIILSRYFGNGTPVIVRFEPDEDTT